MSPILLTFLIILLVLLLIKWIKITLSDLEPTKPPKKDWKEFVDDMAQEASPKPETKAEEPLELHFADKNKQVIKISPELQKRVVNVRTGSKTKQTNRKSKK
jgi:hypothetical protein